MRAPPRSSAYTSPWRARCSSRKSRGLRSTDDSEPRTARAPTTGGARRGAVAWPRCERAGAVTAEAASIMAPPSRGGRQRVAELEKRRVGRAIASARQGELHVAAHPVLHPGEVRVDLVGDRGLEAREAPLQLEEALHVAVDHG